MKPTHASEQTIFDAVRQMADAPAQAAYLASACAGNPKLRGRIEDLLKANQRADEFLEADPHELGQARGQTIALATLSEAPGAVIDKYKLLEKIGEGGFGVVYMAEQKQPIKRRVALKIIKIGMDTREVVARFEAERQALALMDHPSIAKVLDAGATETGRPYFVMELVRGIKITEYCDQKNLSTRERLDLFIKVCQAVQHAHQKGIIHRDLKPSNILTTVNDGVAVPKIIDFGIAKATQMELTEKTVFTRFQQFLGTPAYMSPEQAEITSVDIDTRSDIYSLGVLLYELLTGQTPFDAKELLQAGLDEMRRTIREHEPQRPSTRVGTLGGEELTNTAKRRGLDAPKLVNVLRGDLDWIVMRCLEKDRARRYETANGLAIDIQRHLRNEPVLARSPSAAYRLQKAWRRNKLALSAGAVVVLALVTGISLSTWQALLATRAKTTAIEAETKARAEQQEAETSREAERQAHLQASKEKADARHLLYLANMNLAQQAWAQNNLGRIRELLEDTAVSPERGFEWYYWQRQTHLELKTLRGHRGGVNSVAFSPDGKRIVTGSYDGTARVWEAASGRALLTLSNHNAVVYSAAFSPDGQRIVTGSQDATAIVWETATGKVLVTLRGHTNHVDSVAFSPDGQRIVTGSGNALDTDDSGGDRAAKVWDAATGQELVTLTNHMQGVNSVCFSPDGQRILTCGGTQARVWDPATGRELLTLEGHSLKIESAAFSRDGQRIVTASDDQTAKIWDATTGKELLPLKGHTSLVNTAAFSPDGKEVVTGSDDNTARVWETATGKPLFTLKGHSSYVVSVAFSPSGKEIVTGSGFWLSTSDHTAKLWAASSTEAVTFTGHSNHINSVACSPDGQRIVTGSSDHTAKVWEAATGKESLTLKGHRLPVSSVAFSPDGRQIVTGSADHTAKLWDALSGKDLITFTGHSDTVRSAAFSADGQRVVTGSEDLTAQVWDAATGTGLRTFKGHTGGVTGVAFSPDGRRIVTGSWDKTAKVWEVVSGRELLALTGHVAGISWVAFSPDAQKIFTSSIDRTVKIWETASGKPLCTLIGHGDQIWSGALSPDGKRIVTGCRDHTAKVWETASGKEVLTLIGHDGEIRSVVFSHDGRRIITGSSDHTARVWEAATDRQVADWQEEQREDAIGK